MSRAQPFADHQVCKAVNLLTRENLRSARRTRLTEAWAEFGRGLRSGGSIFGRAGIKPLPERGREGVIEWEFDSDAHGSGGFGGALEFHRGAAVMVEPVSHFTKGSREAREGKTYFDDPHSDGLSPNVPGKLTSSASS